MKIYFGRQIDNLAASNVSAFRLGTPGTPGTTAGQADLEKFHSEMERLKSHVDDKFN